MTVFEILLMAHVLGDWIFQTEWQAVNKATDWRAMGAHIVVYHAIVLALLCVRFGFSEPIVYAVVAGLAVVHTILDRRRPLRSFMRMARITKHREPEPWFIIAVDQSVHLLALGVATLILTR